LLERGERRKERRKKAQITPPERRELESCLTYWKQRPDLLWRCRLFYGLRMVSKIGVFFGTGITLATLLLRDFEGLPACLLFLAGNLGFWLFIRSFGNYSNYYARWRLLSDKAWSEDL
jgi:hypothetical protein